MSVKALYACVEGRGGGVGGGGGGAGSIATQIGAVRCASKF